MKALGTFLLFVTAISIFTCYSYAMFDLGKRSAERTVVDKDLCYAISSEQGRYIGFKLKLDEGYTAYICSGKVK